MTLPTFSSLTVNTLTEFSFIAGSYQELNFDIFTTTGSPVNITTASCSWSLSPYGQPDYPVLTKSGSVVVSGSSVNRFKIALTSNDTISLYGKFVQQPVIISVPGYEYRSDQGIVTIIPRIGI